MDFGFFSFNGNLMYGRYYELFSLLFSFSRRWETEEEKLKHTMFLVVFPDYQLNNIPCQDCQYYNVYSALVEVQLRQLTKLCRNRVKVCYFYQGDKNIHSSLNINLYDSGTVRNQEKFWRLCYFGIRRSNVTHTHFVTSLYCPSEPKIWGSNFLHISTGTWAQKATHSVCSHCWILV